jgi:hypothetical protein
MSKLLLALLAVTFLTGCYRTVEVRTEAVWVEHLTYRGQWYGQVRLSDGAATVRLPHALPGGVAVVRLRERPGQGLEVLSWYR